MKANQKAFCLLIGILAALLCLAPTADVRAGQESAPEHSLNKEGGKAYQVIVVPAASFHSDGFSPYNDFFFSFWSGYMRGDTNAYGCVETGVVIPDNVYISEVYASIYDNDATYNHIITVQRRARSSSEVTEVARLISSGASTSIQSLWTWNLNARITENPEYAYYITDCLSSDTLRLYSVRIWYETDWDYLLDEGAFMPTIRR